MKKIHSNKHITYFIRLLVIPFLLTNFLFIFLSAETFQQSKVPLLPDLKYVSHLVSTHNQQAQRFFNQGLTFIYSFNNEAAYQSFEQATQADPQLAMAYWGMALSCNPNLGIDISPQQLQKGHDFIQKAIQLKSQATPNEQMYIDALSKRFSNDPKADARQLAVNYKDAMRLITDKYPDDLDASSLFAVSAMSLDPEHLWKPDGTPKSGTPEIVAILESILQRDPTHIGANHYYIHTMEASRQPQRALMSAKSFDNIALVLTHLVHTPSHIYLPVGDYGASIDCNERSRTAVQEYAQKYGSAPSKLMHVLLYLARSYTMAGDFKNAKKSAFELQSLYDPSMKHHMEMSYSIPLFVMIRFKDWEGILEQPKPSSEMKLSTSLWHMARSMAYTSLGEHERAKEEQQLFKSKEKTVDHTDHVHQENPEINILKMFSSFLDAKLLETQSQLPLAIQSYSEAVTLQDAIKNADNSEDNAFDWLIILRENLGNALLNNHQYKEAETIFREDLNHHFRNGRALYGLYESLKAQAKFTDAFWIKQALDQSWKRSDIPIDQSI